MKKTATLLLLALCGTASLHAQAPSAKAILQLIHKRSAALGHAFAPAPAMKGTAAPERVSAEADYNDDGNGNVVLTDSARFIYSGYRHSKFDFNELQYIYLGGLEDGTEPEFVYMEPKPNNYDSASLPLVAFDTLHRYMLDTLTGLIFHRNVEAGTFNADTTFNSITNRTYTPSGMSPNSYREVMLYSNGRISRVYGMNYNGTTWDTSIIRTVTYNGSGNVVTDILAENTGSGFTPALLTLYTYNAAGAYLTRTQLNYTGAPGVYDTASRTTNTYYADGKLRTSAFEYNSGTALEPSYKDSLSYTAGVPGYTSLSEDNYDPSGAVFLTYKVITNRINAQQLKDSLTVKINFMGTDFDIASMKINYDALGNPTSGFQYDLQNSAPVVTSSRYWYYEYYPIAAGVKPSPMAGLISFYPNPTTGVIIIGQPAAKAGTRVFVRVTNAAGQMVHSESIIWQGTTQQIVLGNEAAPGRYFISVQDAAGNVLGSQKIIKE